MLPEASIPACALKFILETKQEPGPVQKSAWGLGKVGLASLGTCLKLHRLKQTKGKLVATDQSPFPLSPKTNHKTGKIKSKMMDTS